MMKLKKPTFVDLPLHRILFNSFYTVFDTPDDENIWLIDTIFHFIRVLLNHIWEPYNIQNFSILFFLSTTLPGLDFLGQYQGHIFCILRTVYQTVLWFIPNLIVFCILPYTIFCNFATVCSMNRQNNDMKCILILITVINLTVTANHFLTNNLK